MPEWLDANHLPTYRRVIVPSLIILQRGTIDVNDERAIQTLLLLRRNKNHRTLAVRATSLEIEIRMDNSFTLGRGDDGHEDGFSVVNTHFWSDELRNGYCNSVDV